MRRFFILSAIGQDRPGLVAEVATLVYEAEANLEDSRMTILGSDFAVILLASSDTPGCADRVAQGAKRLERDYGLTILIRSLEGGPRPAIPAAGFQLWEVRADGEDRAGIVAGICGCLAEHRVNILDLNTSNRPGPGGSPTYEMRIRAEIPERVDIERLRAALDEEADRLVIGVALELLPSNAGH